MEIRVYATLRDIVGGKSIHLDDAPGMTVGQMLQVVLVKFPALRAEIFDKQGELARSIHIFINGRDIRYLNGLETTVTAADAIRIFPPVGGGLG